MKTNIEELLALANDKTEDSEADDLSKEYDLFMVITLKPLHIPSFLFQCL